MNDMKGAHFVAFGTEPRKHLKTHRTREAKVIANTQIKVEQRELFDKHLQEWVEDFASFLGLTGQVKALARTLIEMCCKNKFIHNQVKQTLKRCRTFGEVLPTLETTFPTCEIDLSVGEYIQKISRLPDRPTLNRVNELLGELD